MRRKIVTMLMMILFSMIIIGYDGISVEAKVSSEQKKEYINALSQAIRDGVATQNMDIYAKVARGTVGKKCLKQAVLQNRAALMAE